MSVPARASTSDRTAAAVTGRRRDVSYRLDIVAPSVGDVVKHAGGWIFDRARAGWRVRVVVGELIVDRPLRILGADTLTFETALSSIWSREHPQTLAVPTELFEADRWVRDWVLAARDHSLTQIALWGRSHPRELGDIVDFGRHRLTAAAQAFKAQALAAVGIANQAVTDTESFYVGRTPRRMVATDLVRARVDGTLPEFESDWCRIIELKTAGVVT